MFTTRAVFCISVLLPLAARAHVALFHPAMWGFNVVAANDPRWSYDNRPITPLQSYTFKQWWFHDQLADPPQAGQFFELPAGQAATAELACAKSATSFNNASLGTPWGGDIREPNNPNDVCPNDPHGMAEYHTTGLNDTKGCGMAIAYESDVNSIQPEDFAVFSVNQTCVWTRFTDFPVPERMPACPPGGCICAWFWIHSPDSGSEQNYMNGFRCNVTGATSAVPIAKPQVPRRCGADPANGVQQATPGNCTWGAKQPLYWDQAERNNMFEGTYAPPFYNDLYNFKDGAQDDIFADSYDYPLPSPGPNQTQVPKLRSGGGGSPASAMPTNLSTSVGGGSSASSTAASGSSSSQPTSSAAGSSTSVTSSASSAASSVMSSTSSAASSVTSGSGPAVRRMVQHGRRRGFQVHVLH